MEFGKRMVLSLSEVESQLANDAKPYTLTAEHQQLLVSLATPGQLNTLVTSILSDPALLRSVAARSYTHYNNFHKIVLSEAGRFKLRLHLWWPELDQRHIENVHNHGWDFISTIVFGGYLFQGYQFDNLGDELHMYRYFSPTDRRIYSLDYVGTTRAIRTFETKMTAGCAYYLQSAMLHRVVNSSAPTATLVLQGHDIQGDGQTILAERPIERHTQQAVSPFTVDQLGAHLSRLLNHIQRKSAPHPTQRGDQ